MGNIFRDLGYGARMLAKKPGFTLAAILTLALGIGANTAIFSTVNALLLRPYTFPKLNQLVLVQQNIANGDPTETRMAPAEFVDLRESTRTFEQVAAYRFWTFNLNEADAPGAIEGFLVSPNFFDLLEARPMLGRTFLPEEEEPGKDQEILLSYGVWKQRFAGDPGVVGKIVQVNGRAQTVVGVMPKDFRYPLGAEMWGPLALTPAEKAERAAVTLNVVGRMRPEVTLKQAGAEMNQTAARWARDFPKTNTGKSLSLLRVREEQYQYSMPFFLMLQAAAGFVLLLAGANVASLLFARAIERQKEIAVRLSLGASPRRVAQLLITETMLLSLVAAGIAAAVSVWGVEIIRTSMPPNTLRWVAGWSLIQVDGRVLGFTIVLAIAVGILFGLVTASQALRRDVHETLKECGAATSGGAKRHRLLGALVVVEMALALVLLVGAGLMAKGFVHLADGFSAIEPANLLKLETSLPASLSADKEKVGALYERVLRVTASLPGVQAAALSGNYPASNVDNDRVLFTIEGHPVLSESEQPSAGWQPVSAGYFRLLHIPILRGRGFSEQDGREAPRVAVISQNLARRYWLNEDPIGQRVKLGPADSNNAWMTIVGVLADIKQNWWDPQPQPTLYTPYRQAPGAAMTILARVSGERKGIAAEIRSAFEREDPAASVREVQMMSEDIADSIAPIRIIGTLMVVFGILALVLAAVGVYGILAHSVAERTHEIGIRMALGAQPRCVLRMILSQAMKLAAIGLAIGLPLALALNRVMASYLFGIVELSFNMLAGFVLLLVTVALVAGCVPAMRATRVDPMLALREE